MTLDHLTTPWIIADRSLQLTTHTVRETAAKRQKQRMEVKERTTRRLVCEADVRKADNTSKWNRITPNQTLLPTTGLV